MGEYSGLGTYNQYMASKANSSTVKDTEELFIPKNLLVAVTETWLWQLLLWNPNVPPGWERSAALRRGKTYGED